MKTLIIMSNKEMKVLNMLFLIKSWRLEVRGSVFLLFSLYKEKSISSFLLLFFQKFLKAIYQTSNL